MDISFIVNNLSASAFLNASGKVVKPASGILQDRAEGNTFFWFDCRIYSNRYDARIKRGRVETKTYSKIGIYYPYDKGYGFTSRFSIGFCGCFICGVKDQLNRDDCSKKVCNNNEMNSLFDEVLTHKPHTKTKKITLSKNRNSNSSHENVSNLNSSKINQDLNYYQPHNNKESNQYGNNQINNTPSWMR